MPAVTRSWPGPQDLGEPPMVAPGEGDTRVVGRVLFEVDPPRPLVQRVEVAGRLVLPTGVGHERPARPQGVKQGTHDGLRAANHVPARARTSCNGPSAPRQAPTRGSLDPERATSVPPPWPIR